MPSAAGWPDSSPRAGSGRPAAFLCRRFTPGVEEALRERFALTINEDDSILAPPHIGSATEEARDAMGRMLIDGIEALGRGETPPNRLC